MAAITDFTYDFANNRQVAIIRLLISDTINTDANPAIFSDTEITAFYFINSQVWQSSMQWSGTAGVQTLPNPPVSYYRVAALALDTLANNQARLAGAIELLDVKLDLGSAAKALHDQANCFRDQDDNSGAFAIIEQTNTVFSFRQRFWNEWARQIGGVS